MIDKYWKSSPFGKDSIFNPSFDEMQREERVKQLGKEIRNSPNEIKKESEIKVMSNALNSDGNPLKFNSNGSLVKGQKRLYLFTLKSNDGLTDTMTTEKLLSEYQLIFNDSFPVSSFSFTINNKPQKLRKFAQFVSANTDEKLLSKAIFVTCLECLNTFISKAKKEFPNGLSMKDKWKYWGHGREYDYKHSQAKGYPLVYIRDVGIFESDHIGNIVYGNIMGIPYAQSFHDGDFLQKDLETTSGKKNGIDDPYDSYSLAIGATCGDKITISDFIRVFDFHKTVLISKYNVKTFNYRMKFINHNQDKTMSYDESFTVY